MRAGLALWLACLVAPAAWAQTHERFVVPRGSAADRKEAVDEAAAAAGRTAPTMPTSTGMGETRSPTDGRKPQGVGQGDAGHPAPIDLNQAPELSLRALPGIDREDARRIIEHRPYRAPKELLDKQVLPKEKYDKISSRITVKPSKATSHHSKPQAPTQELPKKH